MQLSEINLKIGRKCQLVDSSGNFVDGNVTEEDCTSFVNDRYRQLYLKLTYKFPFHGQYNESVDLVKDQAEYAFTDLTEDVLVLNYVGIKYSSTDEDYTTARRREANLLFANSTDTDRFSKNAPFYRISRSVTNGLGITIMPTPDADVPNGLYVEYVILPEKLSAPEDSPNLPENLQDVMVAYAIADVWEGKRDWSNSNQALNRAMLLEKEFFDNYRLQLLINQ
jgi:hypothetical protein